MLCAAVVPTASEDSDAASNDWSGTWKCTVTINGSSIVTKYSHNGGALQDMTAVKGFDDGDVKKTDGSWGFGDEFGPFGSYYAAVNISTGKIAKHLNPSDLSKTTDGESIDATKYNIMWVIPTVWMKVTDVVKDASGTATGSTLVMSNKKETEDMTAPAHTIDGTVYKYLAIGVYEGYVDQSESVKKLYSVSGQAPTVRVSMPTLLEYANKNTAADGGHALVWNFYQWQLYRFCSLAVMENFDSQAQIGEGNVTRTKSDTGTTISSGPYYGTKAASKTGERLFIENAWGNVWDGVGDTYFSSGLYAGQHSKQVFDSSLVSSTYKTTLNVMSSGYGTTPYSTDLDSWGLPTTRAGSWSSAAPDYLYTDSNACALIVGADRDYGDKAGLNQMQGWSNWSHDGCGSRLAMVFETDPVVSVEYDHSGLEELLKEYGYPTDLMSDLEKKPKTSGKYDQLKDVADFRHVGWIVDGQEYPATSDFAKTSSHTAKSVWVGLPAVTYDHSELIEASDDRYSVSGLSNGLEIKNHDCYEQLPDRDGFAHVGWRIEIEGQKDVEVGPTAKFVTRQSHTAVSLWVEIRTVEFDHSNLTDTVGTTAKGISDLQTSMVIQGNSKYPQLPNTAGYRHVGWLIEIEGQEDVEVGPTGNLVSQDTHTAKSIWKRIIIPIIPDEGDADAIEVIVPEDSEPWIDRNGKTVILVAIVVAIIAELAVLSISRKRRGSIRGGVGTPFRRPSDHHDDRLSTTGGFGVARIMFTRPNSTVRRYEIAMPLGPPQ